MDVMDIANLSTAISQSQLMTQVNTAVLDMTLDSFEGQANEITKMMESSVQPHLGQNLDTYI